MVLLGASLQSILAEEFAAGAASRERVLEAIEELVVDNRLDALELFLDGIFMLPDVVDRALFAEIARLQQRAGFALTAHLPFVWIDISSGNELTRAASVDAIATAVEYCAPLDVHSYVLHATGPFANEVAPGVADPEHDLWVSLMLRGIDRSFGDLRHRLPATPFSVETMEGFPFEWQSALVDRHGLDICCDVAHLVMRGIDPLPFIRSWLPRIRQFHIHGVREEMLGMNVRRRVDHQALGGPGELVPVDDLFTLLTASGYGGPVIVENKSRQDLARSIATLARAAGRV